MQPNVVAGHETQDARLRPIVLVAVALAVAILVSGLIVYAVFDYLEAHPAASIRANPMAGADSQIPPEPHIEQYPAIEVEQLRAQEDHILSTYGWVDKKTGVVRIPIDRAMELQLERGFPTRKEAPK